jgi:hypothetical protein
MTQAQILEPELLVDDDSTPALDALQFHTVTADDVKRLNESFYRYQCVLSRVSVASAAVGIGGVVMSGGSAFAQTSPTGGGASNAAENAATSIAAGVTNAINMIKAIDGIGLAAFGVALAPMGFMVTLRVLNMVLSRV